MPHSFRDVVSAVVLLLSAYSVLKFAFFFVLPYQRRRAALDKSYAGRAFATGTSDKLQLAIAAALAAIVLASHRQPISFLGGMFVGAVLIQLFFHAFHEPVSPEREAPELRSPLKRMSYAIQDRPQLAWKEMTLYAATVVAGIVLYFAN